MKHVVMLNGSPRKATTYKVLSEIAVLLEARGLEVTVLNIADYAITECVGCQLCIRKTSKCYKQDDADEVLSKLVHADGIVLSAPVYLMNIPGKLKNLFDKTASWVHRPPMIGKPVLSVATTAGSGLKDVLKYLEKVAIQWGAFPTGKIARSIATQRPVSPREIERFVQHINAEPRDHNPGWNQLLFYQVQKVLALKVLTIDREYWVQQGWDKRVYFYPCHIPWYKRMFVGLFYKFLYTRVRPTESA
ncbi:MAG: flavodoxin family protein [Anaerolineae bacterium]